MSAAETEAAEHPAVETRAPAATEGAARPRLDPRALRADAILAISTSVLTGVPSAIMWVLAAVGTPGQWAFGALVGVAIAGAILIRRTHPVLALLALTGLAAVHVAIAAPMFPVWFGVLVVLYSAGRWSRWPGRLGALALALVAALLAATWLATAGGLATAPGSIPSLTEILRLVAFAWVPPMLLFSIAVLVGWGVAAVARSEAASSEAMASTRRADEQEERAALARDMHDVVAHSLAVVIAQANGARYTQDPAAKDASLEAIAGTAKQALGDVRLLLAQLRHSQAPDPVASLDGAHDLIDRIRASGLDVRLEELGTPVPLPRTADIAAYRILQEALTNALRHGDRAQPVHVRLQGVHGPQPGIVLDVHNRLRADPGVAGHGVRGMHERARLAGGDAWTGVQDGWFRVRAAFPAGAR